MSETWSKVMSNCPRTTSAFAPFCAGMLLKISTRSLPPSAMNSRVPSDSAKRGKFNVAAHRGGNVGLPVVESVPLLTHNTPSATAEPVVNW